MTHWFPLGRGVLQHKKDVLARHCEAIGRDPSTIELTMAAPVVVTRNDAERDALLARIPEERRPHVIAGGVEVCAEGLQPFIDDGFTGFTFNNPIYRTPDHIALVGELLRLVAGVPAA